MKFSNITKKVIAACVLSFGISLSAMAQSDTSSISAVDTAYAAPAKAAPADTASSAALDAVLDFTSDSTISSALDTMQFDNILNDLDAKEAKLDTIKKSVDAIDNTITKQAAGTTTPAQSTETPASAPPVETPAQSAGTPPVVTPVETPASQSPASSDPVRMVGGAPDNETSSPAANTDVAAPANTDAGKTSASPGAETGTPIAIDGANNSMADSTTAAKSMGIPTQTAATPTRTDDENSPKSKQNTFRGLKKFNAFSIGLNGGVASIGGISGADYNNNNAVPAFGLNLTYFLGRTVALQGSFTYHSEFTGDSLRSELLKYNVINKTQFAQFSVHNYKTQSFDASINMLFNIGNISFLAKKTKVAFYATVGVGIVNYEAKSFYANGDQAYASERVTDLIIPVGVGAKYMLSKNLTANAGYTLKFTNGDKLDATAVNTNNDKYSYGYVGLAYTIGKKTKSPVEWSNPIAGLYEDLSDNKTRKRISSLQEQLDSLSKGVKSQLDSLKLDDDQDGVPNYLDRQLDTPKGAMVDGAGRLIDSDGDGVPDNLDKCPFEKGDKLYDGCKKNVVELDPDAKDVVENASDKLKYKTGSAQIKSGANKALKKLVDLLNKNQGYKLFIAGHTDSDGSERANDQLSLNRAEGVKAFLVKNGISSDRIIAKGLGENSPIASNDSPEGKQINRCVVFQVLAY